MHCHRFHDRPLTRREMLRCANGIGAVALAALAADPMYGATASSADLSTQPAGPLAERSPHFRPRATRVIFLFMDGGPSQVDTFDPKPRLNREHGQPIKVPVAPDAIRQRRHGARFPVGFSSIRRERHPGQRFVSARGGLRRRHGDHPFDGVEFFRATNANYFMHTGSGQQGRPSMGAWATYGLGSQCQDLPGFVVLNSGMIPPGGADCFGSGFLPVAYQGSSFRGSGQPVADLSPLESRPELQQSKAGADAASSIGSCLAQRRHDDRLEGAIANYELAFRMQSAVPELSDLAGETRRTQRCMDSTIPAHRSLRSAMLARAALSSAACDSSSCCRKTSGFDRWDQHSKLQEGHAKRVCDR